MTINYYARDDKSGYNYGSYQLKDPQGAMFFQYMDTPQTGTPYFEGDPTTWQRYTTKVVLPRGSTPGIWGLAEMSLEDKAWNSITYNFVETLIFEPDESTTDYVLFSEMTDSKNLLIQLSSELDAGYGFTYRIIHEDSGYEISGELPTQTTRAASHSRSEYVDVSSLSDGKLIIIVSVKDGEGNIVAVRSNTVTKGKTVDRIEAITTNRLVDVYTLQGVMVKRQISMDELKKGLPAGIYIINGEKFVVK